MILATGTEAGIPKSVFIPTYIQQTPHALN